MAVALHWASAPVLVVAMALGLYMTDLPSGVNKLDLYNWHEWAAWLLVGLVLLQVVAALHHQ